MILRFLQLVQLYKRLQLQLYKTPIIIIGKNTFFCQLLRLKLFLIFWFFHENIFSKCYILGSWPEFILHTTNKIFLSYAHSISMDM